MLDLYAELDAVATVLTEAGVPYALCGGLALAVHGAPRATRDIDLIAAKEDEPKVREAVRHAGFIFESLPMEFTSGVQVQRWSKLVDGKPLMLDFLWATGPLAAIWERRQRISWRDRALWVVSREDLITLKLTAGRPQDLVDIQTLAALEGRRGRP